MGLRVLALWEILSGWVVITACCSPVGKNFGKNNFGKFRFFDLFLFLNEYFFLPFVEYFSKGCRKCVLVVPRNTLGDNNFFEENSLLDIEQSFFGLLSNFFPLGCVYTRILPVHKYIFRKKFLRKKNCSWLWNVERKFFFCRKSPAVLKNLDFLCPFENLMKNMTSERKFHQPLTCRGTFSAFCRNFSNIILHVKNALYVSIWTILKHFFLKNSILFS